MRKYSAKCSCFLKIEWLASANSSMFRSICSLFRYSKNMHYVGFLVQQHQVCVLAGLNGALPVEQTEFPGGVLGEGGQDLFQGVGQPLQHILQGHILGQYP